MTAELNLLDSNYIPQDSEDFMNEKQREFFKAKLNLWRREILEECKETISSMQSKDVASDEIDVACNEINYALELRTRDRERKLLNKIDQALQRLDEGTYGYCEETGDPISLRRLIARPIATFSVEAQEKHERREKCYREEAA
jgi:DnaK suppressor protein